MAGLLGCGGGGDRGDSTTPADEAAPKAGGTLRVGIGGGSTKDTLEPQFALSHAQQVRLRQLYEPLMAYDHDFKLGPGLAEEVTREASTRWVIRLREGVQFHNGKPVEAQDVIFSLRRILDPKAARSGAAGLQSVDSKRLEAVDARTVRVHLSAPSAVLDQLLGEYYNTIVPRDFDINAPVGTGPFKFESFTPGEESRFTKFDGYWQEGRPLLDAVVVTDIADDSARVNALIGGQIDAMDSVPTGQVKVLEGQGDAITVLESESGGFLPITMRCDSGPLRDPRVRKALKLIIDREQMVASAVDGHGRVANDLYAPYDPAYAKDIPQRRPDLEQAKALLRQAGASDLRFTITVAPIATGCVESAELLAQQAKAAGVTIKVDKTEPGTLFGPNYGKWISTVDVFGTRNYLPQVAIGSLPGAVFNTPQWENDRFVRLYGQAMAETDDAKRAELLREMQAIEHEDGGYIIPFFYNFVDAHSQKVRGLVPDRGTLNLSGYDFRNAGVS